MLYLNNITNDAAQSLILTGIPGLTINMNLQFLPRPQQWIIGLDDGTNSIQGVAVMCSPNFLRQWKNTISYGICCLRADGLDPYAIDDFLNNRANLYLLTADEVAEVEADFFA